MLKNKFNIFVLLLILFCGCAKKPAKLKNVPVFSPIPTSPSIFKTEETGKEIVDLRGLGRDDPFKSPLEVSVLKLPYSLEDEYGETLPSLPLPVFDLKTFELHCTGIFADREEMIAILEEGGRSYLVKAGDLISEGLKVKEIKPNQVILLKGSKEIILNL